MNARYGMAPQVSSSCAVKLMQRILRPDRNFTAERSPSVNNRSIVRAMGKAIGGGSSINGMVWVRGHRNDFDHWAKEAGDDAWNYRHVLFRIHNGAAAAAMSSFSPLPIQAPSHRPSSEPQSPWASRPSLTRTASCRKVRAGGAVITNVRIRDGRRLSLQRTGSDWAELGGWARETKTCPTPSCAAPDRRGGESGP